MITGSLVAIVTPMHDDGSLDFPRLRSLIDWHIAEGTDGIVIVGTTGESPTVTVGEHCELIRVAVEHCAGRVPVIAGTGANSTAEAVELTRFAAQAGANAHLSVVPYYNRPTQEGLYRHFRTIAEAVELPLILYNVPGRTVADLANDTVLRLAEVPNIVGLKDATGSLAQASETLERIGNREFDLLSGEDGIVLPILAIGGKGVISVFSNIAPRSMSDLVSAWNAGDLAGARALHLSHLDLCRCLFIETNPVPVKTAASVLGYCREDLRLPLVPMGSANKQRLFASMKAFGLPVREVE